MDSHMILMCLEKSDKILTFFVRLFLLQTDYSDSLHFVFLWNGHIYFHTGPRIHCLRVCYGRGAWVRGTMACCCNSEVYS